MPADAEAILHIDGLKTWFFTDAGVVRAVDGVGFTLRAGETLGIVGESGSGKSVLAKSIMRLLDPPARLVAGSVRFRGRDLASLDEAALRRIRGADMAFVFQDPMTSLNPVLRIGKQLVEAMTAHGRLGRGAARARAVALLRRMGVAAPERAPSAWPHQYSGGMRQRVMLAMGFANRPALLIADEPTTALDVTIQAQILDLMRDLKARVQAAIMLITHDLGVVAEMAQRVVVMYAGRKVEEAPVADLYAAPLHPYTRGLLGAVPRLGSSLHGAPRARLAEIPGQVPSLIGPQPGCAFAGRCPLVTEICRREAPALAQPRAEHTVACHHAGSGT